MIFGIGSDIVENKRFKKLYDEFGFSFAKRILHESELEIFLGFDKKTKQLSYLAKRYAAKEAVAKAFGCGIGQVLSFRDIIIYNEASGQPACQIAEAKQDMINKLVGAPYSAYISLSDEKHYSLAICVIERNSK